MHNKFNKLSLTALTLLTLTTISNISAIPLSASNYNPYPIPIYTQPVPPPVPIIYPVQPSPTATNPTTPTNPQPGVQPSPAEIGKVIPQPEQTSAAPTASPVTTPSNKEIPLTAISNQEAMYRLYYMGKTASFYNESDPLTNSRRLETVKLPREVSQLLSNKNRDILISNNDADNINYDLVIPAPDFFKLNPQSPTDFSERKSYLIPFKTLVQLTEEELYNMDASFLTLNFLSGAYQHIPDLNTKLGNVVRLLAATSNPDATPTSNIKERLNQKRELTYQQALEKYPHDPVVNNKIYSEGSNQYHANINRRVESYEKYNLNLNPYPSSSVPNKLPPLPNSSDPTANNNYIPGMKPPIKQVIPGGVGIPQEVKDIINRLDNYPPNTTTIKPSPHIPTPGAVYSPTYAPPASTPNPATTEEGEITNKPIVNYNNYYRGKFGEFFDSKAFREGALSSPDDLMKGIYTDMLSNVVDLDGNRIDMTKIKVADVTVPVPLKVSEMEHEEEVETNIWTILAIVLVTTMIAGSFFFGKQLRIQRIREERKNEFMFKNDTLSYTDYDAEDFNVQS